MISIIIPFYNASPHIERCLRSVVSQTYKDFEIVLINDCSSDNSFTLVEKFIKSNPTIKFQIYSHTVNKGISASRNLGMKISEGEYLFFIDADDELSDVNSLEFFAEYIPKNYDFITANVNFKLQSGRIEKSNLSFDLKEDLEFRNEDVFKGLIDKKISVIACNKLYSKAFLNRSAITFEEGIFYEDELWTFQVCYFAKKAFALNVITYNYFRGNPTAITESLTPKHIESLKILVNKLAVFIDKEKIYQTDIQKVTNHFIMLCYWYLKNEKLHQNKKEWKTVYESFKKSYGNSKMNDFKKHFRWSPSFSYSLLTLKMRQSKKPLPFVIQKILNRLNIV